MIIEGLAIGALINTVYNLNKAVEMDERALKKYAKAFEQHEEAELLVKRKAEYTDKRLSNVAKKKRAIIQNTVPRFTKVYGQIQKVNVQNKAEKREIILKNSTERLSVLNAISISVKKEFTDKEFVCGLITKGFARTMVMDSEKYLSAANNQMRASNVVYSQAQSIGEIYDAIAGRADRIAKLLMAMNALFVKSITETERVITTNGLDVRRYSEYDKGILMTCVNIAVAMSDIIDVPVVDEDGVLCDSALKMIETGEQYIKQMNSLIES